MAAEANPMADATSDDKPGQDGPDPGKTAPQAASAAPAPDAETTGSAPPKPTAATAPAPKAAAAPAHKPPAAPPGPPDPPPPAGVAVPPFLLELQERLGGAGQLSYWVGDWTVIVPVDRLLETASFLRDAASARFDYCSDVTATDWPTRPERFDVIHCLYSTVHRHRVRIKVRVGDGQPVASVTGLWPAANWLEREVYDMFGIPFTGHPDLRRILMPEEWQGHPERKDYPLEGPGELLLESPEEWLKLRRAADEADIE
jgi:NADH/F420H2 dehydrogenase subunit C